MTHSMANVCAREDGQASSAKRSVLLTDMDKIAARSAVARTVEAAITFPASAIALLVSQDHCKSYVL